MIIAIAILYTLVVGAFGWEYVQNGVFLAYDDRPVWRAVIETAIWPVLVAVELIHMWVTSRRA